jgi:regulator of sigma E protease
MDHLTALLSNVFAFVFSLGVIIFVHEAGHLLVAKAFGMRVLTFSLGFGRRLWGVRRGETDYRVSLVPLGGYVKLGGENPEEATGDPREFSNRPRWQRVFVYLAGPTMNVLLAILLIAVVFMVGIEVPDLQTIPPVLGTVEAGSSAAAAGLEPGDRVVAVERRPVTRWQDVAFAMMTSPERPVALTVERGERRFAATVVPAKVPRYEFGDSAGMYPVVLPRVSQVLPGSPGERAGFAAGDELRAVDGRPVRDTQDFVAYVDGKAGQEVAVEVRRGERTLVLPVVPADQGGQGQIGLMIGVFQRYGPARALLESVRYNASITRQTFVVLGKIVTGRLAAKSALSGPIEIAALSGAAARSGFKNLIYLMGFISISIAILNLLPVPILDGGQIAILLVEGAMRRDLSLRLKERIQQVGFVLLVALMVMVLYFDLVKNLAR